MFLVLWFLKQQIKDIDIPLKHWNITWTPVVASLSSLMSHNHLDQSSIILLSQAVITHGGESSPGNWSPATRCSDVPCHVMLDVWCWRRNWVIESVRNRNDFRYSNWEKAPWGNHRTIWTDLSSSQLRWHLWAWHPHLLDHLHHKGTDA